MARTVEDAVRVFDVIAGYDPADPITERARENQPTSYLDNLKLDGLQGARLGLFRRYLDDAETDQEMRNLTEAAVRQLEAQGAEVIDSFEIENFESLVEGIWCNTFHSDINRYLISLGERASYRTIGEIVESGLYSPYIGEQLKRMVEDGDASEPCPDLYHREKNIEFRDAVRRAMDTAGIDAIIYPTWSNPPRRVGDTTSPAGDNSQHLAPHTGFPAITVPMGHTRSVLPAGLTFVGRLFSEPELIGFVFAYEQATQHRTIPVLFSDDH